MSKSGNKLIRAAEQALKYTIYKGKADELLRMGDAAMNAGQIAEGKRLLRRCRRYRQLQKECATEYTL